MVLNNLSKFVEHYRKQLSSIEGTTVNIRGFEGLPFYCDWPNSEDEEKASPIRPVIGNTDCCFNHAIGLPTKYVSEVGEDTPLRLFDYEKMLNQRLYQYKHLWIKKATGLGVTEFMLRYMAISMPLPLPNVGS
jgi:hypothetical protein